MRIKKTVHESEQNSLYPPTRAATFSSLNDTLVQLQHKLILKVGVANVIKNIYQVFNINDHLLKHVYQMFQNSFQYH